MSYRTAEGGTQGKKIAGVAARFVGNRSGGGMYMCSNGFKGVNMGLMRLRHQGTGRILLKI